MRLYYERIGSEQNVGAGFPAQQVAKSPAKSQHFPGGRLPTHIHRSKFVGNLGNYKNIFI